jgi:hypothetical protein
MPHYGSFNAKRGNHGCCDDVIATPSWELLLP